MNNFYPLGISYLTYCVTTNVIKFGNAICLNFSPDVKILFPPGRLKKKNMNNFKTQNNKWPSNA